MWKMLEGRMVRYVKIFQGNSILTNSIENGEPVLSKEGNSFSTTSIDFWSIRYSSMNEILNDR